MNKPLLTDNSPDFNAWYNAEDPSFVEINAKSRVPYKWLAYSKISEKYKNSIIKPVNKYAEVLAPRPKLIRIDESEIVLRYSTHADIYLIDNYPGYDGFYNVDRPWIRQYYQTSGDSKTKEGCFPGNYKLYIPWFLDDDLSIKISEVEDSPFLVLDQALYFRKIKETEQFVEPSFVKFNFKKEGSHMKDTNFGIILKDTPMFDIAIASTGIIEERVRKFYED
jgi:hypothetical protein